MTQRKKRAMRPCILFTQNELERQLRNDKRRYLALFTVAGQKNVMYDASALRPRGG